MRQMSRALNDREEEGYDRIPDTRNAIAQYFELYSMSGDPEDFEKMVISPMRMLCSRHGLRLRALPY